MAEYIEREPLIKYCTTMLNLAQKHVQSGHGESDIWKAIHRAQQEERKEFLELLKNAPVVDAIPIQHGHWIFEEDEEKSWCTKAICSACGNVVENNLGLSVDTRRQYFLEDNHCCRICGALMDGKEDEDEVSES